MVYSKPFLKKSFRRYRKIYSETKKNFLLKVLSVRTQTYVKCLFFKKIAKHKSVALHQVCGQFNIVYAKERLFSNLP